jgi:hypothetical protein
MTRKSKRELERAVDDLDSAPVGTPVEFADYYEYYQHSVNAGHLGAGPDEEAFFGRDLTESEHIEFWKRLLQVWDGEEEAPC